jgi:hypothetical protein
LYLYLYLVHDDMNSDMFRFTHQGC